MGRYVYIHLYRFFSRKRGHHPEIELNKVFLTAEPVLMYVSVYEFITYSKLSQTAIDFESLGDDIHKF